jgi:hypothetical protein
MSLPAPSSQLHPPLQIPEHTVSVEQVNGTRTCLTRDQDGGAKDAMSFSYHTAAVISTFDLHEDSQAY